MERYDIDCNIIYCLTVTRKYFKSYCLQFK